MRTQGSGIGLLSLFGLAPEFVQLIRREVGQTCAICPGSNCCFHGGPPARELPTGCMERFLGIHTHFPAYIYQGEQHIAQLELHCSQSIGGSLRSHRPPGLARIRSGICALGLARIRSGARRRKTRSGSVCLFQLINLLSYLNPHIIQGVPLKTAGHRCIGNLTRPQKRRLGRRNDGDGSFSQDNTTCSLVKFLRS